MTNKKSIFSRFRLVIRRSPPLLKCVVLAAIVLSTVALLTLRSSILQTREKTEALREQAAQLEQENGQLEQNIAQLGTVQSVKRIAVEELGLVDPDSAFFEPVDSTNPE